MIIVKVPIFIVKMLKIKETGNLYPLNVRIKNDI